MNELYSIERNEEYLEHYGVKGMKWKNHVYAVKDQAQGRLNQVGGAASQLASTGAGAAGSAAERIKERAPHVTIDTTKAKQEYAEKKRKAKMWAIRKTAKGTVKSAMKSAKKGKFKRSGGTLKAGYKVLRGLIRI